MTRIWMSKKKYISIGDVQLFDELIYKICKQIKNEIYQGKKLLTLELLCFE